MRKSDYANLPEGDNEVKSTIGDNGNESDEAVSSEGRDTDSPSLSPTTPLALSISFAAAEHDESSFSTALDNSKQNFQKYKRSPIKISIKFVHSPVHFVH